jgi:chromosome segregation ATPase
MGWSGNGCLRFREAVEETEAGKSAIWGALNSGCMSAELTEDGCAQNASLRQLQAPGTIAANDVATKLAAADAAISDIQELLGKVRTSHDELRQTLADLERERDEWRRRAEQLSERPWWRRLAG